VSRGIPFGNYDFAFDTNLPRPGSIQITPAVRRGPFLVDVRSKPFAVCDVLSATLAIDMIFIGVFVVGSAARSDSSMIHSATHGSADKLCRSCGL
jgi:hypothetical protein